MSEIFVNCARLPFASTLGVASFILRLSGALAREHEVTFLVADVEEVEESPAGPLIRSMSAKLMPLEAARVACARNEMVGVELLPHQFQGPEFLPTSLLICHDLHVFDIPWKYEHRAEEMQANFRRNLTGASAVITEFPRTYYDVEHVAGISLMNLYLTESPLLLDTTLARTDRDGRGAAPPIRIIYPAQLQRHKNHEALVRGLAALGAAAPDVVFVCPGSDFDLELTARIRRLVADAGLEDSFEFAGRVSDAELVKLYRTADAAMIPSLAEGGAYVALEAIAAGLPVAVNRIRSAEMHLESLSAEVLGFDASSDSSVGNAVVELVNRVGSQNQTGNDDCRAQLAQLSWGSVAKTCSEVIAYLEGSGARPVLRIDQSARLLGDGQ